MRLTKPAPETRRASPFVAGCSLFPFGGMTMPVMPPTFSPLGQRTKRERDREHDERRGSARKRGYSAAWDKAAKGHLRNSPLCRYCDLRGLTNPATAVDHLYPHQSDTGLFWNRRLWVSTCDACHSGFKQALERRGKPALDALAVQLGIEPLEGWGGSKV